MGTEKPRILVAKQYLDYLSGGEKLSGEKCSYIELYNDGYCYYFIDGSLAPPSYRAFNTETQRWSLDDIEESLEEGWFIEFTGEKRDLFLAEHVLKR